MKMAAVFLLLVLTVIVPSHSVAAWEKKLSGEVAQVLQTADEVTLYSLNVDQPPQKDSDRFYGYPVLGKVHLNGKKAYEAAAAFKAAIDHGGQQALCFNPRHALRIVANGHTYDYFLCYECGEVDVIKDGTIDLASFTAGGSPEILNGLLKDAGIRLPYFYTPEAQAARERREKEDRDNYARERVKRAFGL